MSSIEVIARGLALRDNQVLLCINKKGGYAYLPGGHVEFGETSPEALEREFEEETGLAVRAGGLLLVAEGRFEQGGTPRHELNLVFHVEHPHSWPGEVPSLEEKLAFEWRELALIADTDLRPASIRAWLAAGGKADGLSGPPFITA